MTKPMKVLTIGQEYFPSSSALCQGPHLAAVVNIIETFAGPLEWYAADVDAPGSDFPDIPGGRPRHIGSGKQVALTMKGVDQFRWGVFLGVSGSSPPTFREGGVWAEDEEGADLGDAEVELRAFDTTYIEVAVRDSSLAQFIGESLRKTK